MFPPNQTGTSFYSKNLADALVRNGLAIELLTTTNKNIKNDDNYQFKIIRIPSLNVPLKNYFKHLRFCSFIPGNYKRVKEIIEDFNPDSILLINHYLDIAFLAVYASKTKRIPLFISIGTQLQSLNPVRNKLLNFLDRLIVGNLIFPFAKKIISWDNEIERYIKDIHNRSNSSKSIIIPFGVNGDLETFDKYENQYSECRQILGVGAIIDHRDYIYQILVFNELLKVYPDLILKIIGNKYIDKPEKLAAKLGISDKVIFTGEIPHEEVLKEYKNSLIHWMMLCGKYVGLGTSTIEAMLMEVPVVSNVPENLFGRKLLCDMENYIYSDGISIEKDTDKICKIIADNELRKRIGQNGRKFVKKYLNWDAIARKFKEEIF